MQPVKGILIKLVAVVCFICMNALIKAASPHVPPGEAVFFRGFCALPIIIGWLAMRGDLATGLKVKAPMAHVWRGFIGTTSMGCLFAGLAFLPLPEVTVLGYAMPLLVVVFAAMFLDERVGVFRLGAVALGMLGVLIVLAPRVTALDGGTVQVSEAVGAMIVLFGATCGALAQVHIRNMVRVEQTSAIVFWFSITSTVLALATIPFGWVIPTGREVVYLVVAGLLGGTGQIFLTSCYRYADASVVAPFDYASILFALVIGYFVFAEVPTGQMLLGALIIVTAGVIIILRERHLGLERDKARASRTPAG
ncbi:DMT family transporter [Pseudooceanicola sediminis]|uniref:DMT family transporter n=1 Tax=Pseudooceanicola sediminis TaxID=2211117 RepID=A0A399J3B7_9RHOB|nr:DMT family transporter [Pseudooceanicola sediminis]KAA2313315.1 DMT family transporter [Puniceibacterium sp. HSS470]RII38402.1 DMT family transporter [Pseudooceanicola sediminis]|tara:strand:+ start:23502 stop:24425 length:924 start_codon:yes stop_codon:yes gene_type:complete